MPGIGLWLKKEYDMTILTTHEQQEIDRANQEEKQPIVFVHGLWLLASSWENWRPFFEERGYVTIAPGWPDDPETAEEANADPEVLAGKRLKHITQHYADAIQQLKRKPVIVGHSFGGLLAQLLANEGLSVGTVAIDPAPFRGVLPFPFAELKTTAPVLSNPANYRRAVALTFEQFRYSFANVVGEDEAHELYEKYAVPGSGTALFQAAAANINPRTEDRLDPRNPERGPLLLIAGEKDHTVPLAVVRAAYDLQKHNPAVTEFHEMLNHGHSLTIDKGWYKVAEVAYDFIARQLPQSF
jgi:pimeloyl-ACP methyl ester carboxylesterase